MTPVNKEGEQRLRSVRWFQGAGYALVVGTAISLNAIDKLQITWNTLETSVQWIVVLQSLLLVTTIGLIFQWIKATTHEFQLLEDELTEIPKIKGQTYTIMLTLSIALGSLACFYDNILVFASIHTVLNAVSFSAGSTVNSHLVKAIDVFRQSESVDNEQANIINEIERYYLKRPQRRRVCTIIGISLIVIGCAITSKSMTGQAANIIEYAAYTIMILNIIWSEILIETWRNYRDRYTGR